MAGMGIRSKEVIYKVAVFISLPCIKLSSYIYMYKTTIKSYQW